MLIERAIFALSGPDAERYLNGQVTNDVARANAGTALLACVTNHKGKLDAAPIFLHRIASDAPVRTLAPALTDTPSLFLIDAPLTLRETLFTRLDRYIIADDCTLTDVTDTIAIDHSDAPRDNAVSNPHRWGILGTDHFIARTTTTAPAPEIPTAWQASRIAAGIPLWETDITSDNLAPEIPYFVTHAIRYDKGCYIGQEVISRIKSAGKVNRTLCPLIPTGSHSAPTPEEPLALPTPLTDPVTGAAAGALTSFLRSPDHPDGLGLGSVKRAFSATGYLLHAGSGQNVLSLAVEIGKSPAI